MCLSRITQTRLTEYDIETWKLFYPSTNCDTPKLLALLRACEFYPGLNYSWIQMEIPCGEEGKYYKSGFHCFPLLYEAMSYKADCMTYYGYAVIIPVTIPANTVITVGREGDYGICYVTPELIISPDNYRLAFHGGC